MNPFFSNEKPGRRSVSSPSGDFGKLISESLERANKGVRSLRKLLVTRFKTVVHV